jgi:hypothetical protein
MLLAALVWLSGTFPKAIEAADKAVGLTPVPLNATVCGLLVELLVMVSEPAGCAPKAVGLRVMPILQVAPALSEPELGHGADAAAARAYGPPAVTDKELIEMAEEPVFLNPTEWTAPVVPTTTLPKFTNVAETVVWAMAAAEENRLNIANIGSRKNG